MTEPAIPRDRAWVYKYSYWDEDTGAHKQSELYATRDVILCGLGTPLINTAMQVDRNDLRDGGIYVPTKRGVAPRPP